MHYIELIGAYHCCCFVTNFCKSSEQQLGQAPNCSKQIVYLAFTVYVALRLRSVSAERSQPLIEFRSAFAPRSITLGTAFAHLTFRVRSPFIKWGSRAFSDCNTSIRKVNSRHLFEILTICLLACFYCLFWVWFFVVISGITLFL